MMLLESRERRTDGAQDKACIICEAWHAHDTWESLSRPCLAEKDSVGEGVDVFISSFSSAFWLFATPTQDEIACILRWENL